MDFDQGDDVILLRLVKNYALNSVMTRLKGHSATDNNQPGIPPPAQGYFGTRLGASSGGSLGPAFFGHSQLRARKPLNKRR